MTIFSVPGDFSSIPLALESPLVQNGDTILAKNGDYNQVVVVPFDGAGTAGGEPAEDMAETVPGNQDPPPDDKDAEEREDPSGNSPPEGGDNSPPGQELPESQAPAGSVESGPEDRQEVVPVVRSSVKMIKVERGTASPYWMTVHRCVWELGRTSEKGRRWNRGSVWIRFR